MATLETAATRDRWGETSYRIRLCIGGALVGCCFGGGILVPVFGLPFEITEWKGSLIGFLVTAVLLFFPSCSEAKL